MLSGTFNLRRSSRPSGASGSLSRNFSGSSIFLIAGVAETRRLPFDLPEAESELVAGYHTEYSSLKFGMFFVGEYMGIVLISAFITVLFLGGWRGPVPARHRLVLHEDVLLYRSFYPHAGCPAEAALRPAHGDSLEGAFAADPA